MAIRKKNLVIQDTTYDENYCVIVSLSRRKPSLNAPSGALLYVYRNKDDSDRGLKPLTPYPFQFEFDIKSEKNFVQQAYDFLKTLPEFVGAEDC